ncbi:MAG: molybdenum cofactor guanylyltransferase [Pseudonocardiaceae bacterium]
MTAGLVLVGGRSSRMGTAKAALEWHGSTLLHRTLGVLRRAVDGPLLVIRAPGQPLPQVGPQVRIIQDPQEGLGPLQGIAAGLTVLAGGVQGVDGDRDASAGVAFLCAVDLPFLHPAFIRRVLGALTEDTDVVLPVASGYPQPLAAAYRVRLAPLVAELVAGGARRPALLFRRCATLRLDDAALLADPVLAAADPTLDSVLNVNSPEDYQAARCRPAPWVTVQHHGASAGDRGPCTIRAATLSGAAAAVGLTPDHQAVAELNGDRLSDVEDVSLVSGDRVVFRAAAADTVESRPSRCPRAG